MQTVFSKGTVPLRLREGPKPRWADPADVHDVNACMHVDTGTDLHLSSVKEPRAFWELGVRSDKAVDRNREKQKKSVRSQTIWVEGILVKEKGTKIQEGEDASCLTSSFLLFENDKSNKYPKHTNNSGLTPEPSNRFYDTLLSVQADPTVKCVQNAAASQCWGFWVMY